MAYDRDALLAATDLASLADELLGPRRGAGRAPAWRCPNPTHAQSGATPPVSIFAARTGSERWHCFGCGVGGSALDLVMVAGGLGISDAFSYLAGRAGLSQNPASRTPRSPRAVAPRPRPSPPPALRDPEGLARYVGECARRLWDPSGAVVRDYLVEGRGIPRSVLYANRIGADLGKRVQRRPEGIAAIWSPAAVFPAIERERATFVQLRLLSPGARMPRYLNAASSLAPNPKVALFRPANALGRCVVVTEGPTDALSGAAAGFAAAAVLGTGAARDLDALASRLAPLDRPIVLALDADAAGEAATGQILEHLRAWGARVARLHLPAPYGDLNEWMRACPDWGRVFGDAVRGALALAPQRPGLTLAR